MATKQVKPRADERFIHEAHSFMSVTFSTYLSVYMYVCIYNFLWIILIPSLWSELFNRGTLADLSKNLMISLSLRNN